MWRLLVASVLVTVVLGCGDDDESTTCIPGTVREPNLCLFCPDGRQSFQRCNAAGDGYNACECPSADAGLPDGGTSDGGPRIDAAGGCDVTIGAAVAQDTCGGATLCVCTPEADPCADVGCSLCASPGACETALPRRYRVAPFSASVPTTKPDGSSWDVGGGAPDLFVWVEVDGSVVLPMTAVADDTFAAMFTGSFADVTLVSGSEIVMEVRDQDVTGSDGAFICTFEVTPALLRGRILSCTGDLGDLLGSVVPL